MVHKRTLSLLCFVLAFAAVPALAPAADKQQSVFYPPHVIKAARDNARRDPNVAEAQQAIIARADRWLQTSDDELWSMMFGHSITRSWHVWSDGICPSCHKTVTPYTWKYDVVQRPWKMRCPHCSEDFPKNDFHKFYLSGLDPQGVFDPSLADRSLLFNEEHPDPQDPLHQFGVDDGEGYVDGGHRWRFIGRYLIAAQWKSQVLAGIDSLSQAYVVTGSPAYAHKAGVLLDRVADLYPNFDFGTQGKVYEIPPKYGTGYVSIWHDTCIETRLLAHAYDRVFDAMSRDQQLVDFLSTKARQHHLANTKSTWADIQRNIEDRILRDALQSPEKIYSNYPQTPMTETIIRTILDWPNNRADVMASIDGIVARSTSVDGVTGEKGLAGYASYATGRFAEFLADYAAVDPTFLPELLDRHPDLRKTYRFYMDTWCLQSYYPMSGDVGYFGMRNKDYAGVGFRKLPTKDSPYAPSVQTSMRSLYTFFWQLYEATGDPGYAQVMYHAIDQNIQDLPQDLFAQSADTIRFGVAAAIKEHGPALNLQSVNKEAWHLAILRSGQGEHARALWLDYDGSIPGGYHAHADGMNLGLFAYGLNLMPEFGYPPVQYGGWETPQVRWYSATAAHNTVLVNDENQADGKGSSSLWAIGDAIRVIRADGAEMAPPAQRFGRIAALIDAPQDQFYVIDLNVLKGGDKHTRYQHSYFGSVKTQRVSLREVPQNDTDGWQPMRNIRTDPNPEAGWRVNWQLEDKYGILPPGRTVHLAYTDLTAGAEASLCEQWVSPNGEMEEEAWIPAVLTTRRKSGNEDLASVFVAIIDPYIKSPTVVKAHRLDILDQTGALDSGLNAAVEVQIFNGGKDMFLFQDIGAESDKTQTLSRAPVELRVDADRLLSFTAEVCWIRCGLDGDPERIVICNGRNVVYGDLSIELSEASPIVEIALSRREATVVSGDAQTIRAIKLQGKALPISDNRNGSAVPSTGIAPGR